MNNKQVAHVWASQNRDSAKGSNFYFDGPTIYSYGPHFPIATIHDAYTRNGFRIVLFTDRGYSISTSRHISYARQALAGLNMRSIEVPDIRGIEHTRNLNHMRAEFDAALLKASRARSHKDMHMSRAFNLQTDAIDYAHAFNRTVPDWAEYGIDSDALENMRKAERERKAQEAAKRKRDMEARRDKWEQRAEAWRNGGNANELELWRFADFPTLLRLKPDNSDVIETSRGAEVPRSVAPDLLRLVERTRKTGKAYTPKDRYRVGYFNLRRIESDGTLIVGCHRLEYAEVARMAERLQ